MHSGALSSLCHLFPSVPILLLVLLQQKSLSLSLSFAPRTLDYHSFPPFFPTPLLLLRSQVLIVCFPPMALSRAYSTPCTNLPASKTHARTHARPSITIEEQQQRQ